MTPSIAFIIVGAVLLIGGVGITIRVKDATSEPPAGRVSRLAAILIGCALMAIGVIIGSPKKEGPDPIPTTAPPTQGPPITQPPTTPAQTTEPPPNPGPCAGYSITIKAPEKAASSFDIVISASCPAPAGREYWLFVQLDNVGEHKTTNYYPKLRITAPPGGQNIFRSNVTGSTTAGVRHYLVMSIDAGFAATMKPDQQFINNLPEEARSEPASATAAVQITR